MLFRSPVLPRFEVPNGIPTELEGYFETAQSVLNRGLMELQNQSTEYMQGKSLLDVLFGGDEVVDNKMEQFQLQQMNMVIASNEAMLAMTTLTEEERTAIEQENSDIRMSIADIEFAQKQRQAVAMQGILSNLQNVFDKNTVAYKATASADALISGLKASQDSYSALAPIPLVGPALGFAAAGASLASTAKTIKNIWKVKKGDKSVDTSAVAQSTQPSIIKPSESIMSSSDLSLQSQLQKEQKVYVVYDDIQQAGNRVEVVKNETSF